jgi:hypothetical protein
LPVVNPWYSTLIIGATLLSSPFWVRLYLFLHRYALAAFVLSSLA